MLCCINGALTGLDIVSVDAMEIRDMTTVNDAIHPNDDSAVQEAPYRPHKSSQHEAITSTDVGGPQLAIVSY